MNRIVSAVVAIVVPACMLVGCEGFSSTGGPGANATPNLVAKVGRPADLLEVNSVLLMPVMMSRELHDKLPSSKPFTQQLLAAAERELTLEVVTDKRDLGSSSLPESFSVADAVAIGKERGSDAVLVTTLHRYNERRGSAVGADDPASVTFSMELLRVTDGRSIWEATYSFKDDALINNLFKIEQRFEEEGKGGWRKADEVLDSGFTQAFRDFSDRRVALFATR